MTNQELSAAVVNGLRAAAMTKSVDGSVGKAVAILRLSDKGAKYNARQGTVAYDGATMLAKDAVNFANKILKAAGLLDHRIAYPGADYVPTWIKNHPPANDRHAVASVRGGV